MMLSEIATQGKYLWLLNRARRNPEVLIKKPHEKVMSGLYEMAITLAKERELVGPISVIFLGNSPEGLPVEERIATILFSGLVFKVDDILDNNPTKKHVSSEDLLCFLLNTKTNINSRVVTINEILDEVLSNLSKSKSEVVTGFINEMISLQIEKGNKSVPGSYGFNEALVYKTKSNYAFLKTGLTLGEGSSGYFNAENLIIGGTVAQMLDDRNDTLSDLRTNTQNLFVGMATEVWKSKGQPPDEDFVFLMREFRKGVIDSESIYFSPEMGDTRIAYRLAFDVFLGSPNVPWRNALRTIKYSKL